MQVVIVFFFSILYFNHCVILRMLANHAELVVKGNKVSLRPMSEDGRILINGVPIVGVTHLNPNDRLVFGSTQLWLFRHPALEAEAGVSDSPMLNYDYFLNEMAAKSGLTIQADASDSRGCITLTKLLNLKLSCKSN